MATLNLKDIKKSYGNVEIIKGVDLSIEDREFCVFVGPSGCGKSTLLYMVGGFVPPSEGAIRIDGRPVSGPGPDRGPVFQEFALFAWKTVIQNIAYGLHLQGKSRAEAGARAAMARWVADYNQHRPHSALGYATPAAFAAQLTAMGDQLRATELLRRSPIAPSAQPRQIQQRTLGSAG